MDAFDNILDFITNITNPLELISLVWRYIGMLLCSLVYGLIAWLYQVFITVGRLNILSTDTIEGIYERVTMILTIVMVFYITFEFVKHIIQPDNIVDKEKGALPMIVRLVGAIILIAFVPTIFSTAYDLQNKIIDNGVINKIILGKDSLDYAALGNEFSSNTMSVFIRLNEEACAREENAENCKNAQIAIDEQLRQMREKKETFIHSFYIFYKTVPIEDGLFAKKVHIVDFHWFLALVVGCFIIYMLVLYSIDLAVRYGQMVLLQIISPVAVISFAAPNKDGIFQKWLRQCITTYLDLFIRLFIMHFILLVINVLFDSYGSGDLFAGIDDATWYVKMLTYVALVMGLLVFANKAPKMIQELFPSGGAASIGYGLNGKERFEPTGKILKGIWNAGKKVAGIAAAVATGVNPEMAGKLLGSEGGGNLLGSLLGGEGNPLGKLLQNEKLSSAFSKGRAVFNGIKAGAGKQGGVRQAVEAVQSSYAGDQTIRDAGGDPLKAKTYGTIYSGVATQQDRVVKKLETVTQTKDAILGNADEVKYVRQFKSAWESAKSGGLSKEEIEDARKAYKKAQKAVLTGKIIVEADGSRSIGYGKTIDHEGNITYQGKIAMDAEDMGWYDRTKEQLQKMQNDIIGETTTIKIKTPNKQTGEIEEIPVLTKDLIIEIERNGKKERVPVSSLTSEEFAENLGSIDTAAKQQAGRIKDTDDYTTTHANAQAADKK